MILFLALAFTRPFLRAFAEITDDFAGRKILLVVDTSASMQRDGLWEQAREHVVDVLEDLDPQDQIGLMIYDSRIRMIVGLTSQTVPDLAAQKQQIIQAFDTLEISNAGSQLGIALIDAAANHLVRDGAHLHRGVGLVSIA